jgi:hypothetical protein
VIDRQFVENLPLNGRSFNTLLELTPGVVLGPKGFNVNGQRDNVNYYTVDGVSANFGGFIYSAGQGPATTSFGGTNSLLSIDALQEFRIQTSTFAPEYGRSPGGQVGVTTRSGTNAFHGDIFNYFRNDALDAGDWFYNAAVGNAPPGTISRPRLRQNDFGGVLGGPIVREKTFFFLSYEGLRLLQPQVQYLFVPNLATRQSVPAPVNQLLNAFPLPNGPDQGNGFAAYTQTASAQQALDVGALRVDQAIGSRISLFGRVSFASSSSQTPSYNQLVNGSSPSTFVTAGLNAQLSPASSNQLRFNYSSSKTGFNFALTTAFGGTLPDLSLLAPAPYTQNSVLSFNPYSDDFASFAGYQVGPGFTTKIKQFNLIDDFSYTISKHVLKFGVDYRHMNVANPWSKKATFSFYPTISDLMSEGSSYTVTGIQQSSEYVAPNFSVYAQDTWRIGERIVLTYGLRWDINQAPTGINGTIFLAPQSVNDPANLSLSPSRQLWNTQLGNFAPRVGVAFRPLASDRFIIRSGFGVFYDIGSSSAAAAAISYPFNNSNLFTTLLPLPLSNPAQYLPGLSLTPPYNASNPIFLTDPQLTSPYSMQWNLALEFSPKPLDSVTLTYLGQAGRRLPRYEQLGSVSNANVNLSTVALTENGSLANYDALQLQYRHQLGHGLQVLANYTWSHSLDDASKDLANGGPFVLLPQTGMYGNSDFDVRHNFSAAVTYDFRRSFESKVMRSLFDGWGMDSILYARTGLPIDVQEGDPSVAYISLGESRPDVVAGQPFWVSNPQAPGGQSINPKAFTLRPPDRQGNLSRNGVPGFGYTQWDASVRRSFALAENWKLQLRLDLFNILNHPNFTNPQPFFNCNSATPSQCTVANPEATTMLNQSLPGLSAIYQNGGPRSLQISLKLLF